MRLTEKWLKRAEERTGKNLTGSYTSAFFFLCVIVFPWYYCIGRTLMWKGDSWTQHYKALLYYSRYLRKIVGSFFTGHPSVPAFDLSIGEGNDILETLHYYVIGDPFAFFSILVPSSCLVFYYIVMILLRMYLSGLAFLYMCRYFGTVREEGKVKTALLGYGSVLGSLVYVFAYWTLLNAARHPYFLNPLIYFPLLVVGVEKIIRREKPDLFVASVAIAALSNFYFFYVLALLTGLYALVRILYLHYVEKEKIIASLFRLFVWALLGAALAAVILMPMCRAFLTNGRMDTKNTFRLLYPLSYYGKLPSLLLSSGDAYWICMGFAVPVFLSLCLLFRRKGYAFLKLCMACCFVMMMFPIFGRAFNGFAYITNRWSWVLALLAGLSVTLLWEEISEIQKSDWHFLCIAAAVYTTLCIVFWNSRTWRSFSAVILLGITLYLVRPGREKKAVRRSLITMGAVSIALNSFWLNAYVSDSYASKSAYIWDAIAETKENETTDVIKTVRQHGDQGWFRYAGPSIETNGNLVAGVSNTQFYWTIGSPATAEYRTKLGLSEYSLYKFYDYDGRATLTNLAAVKYYLLKPEDKNPVPYGFELLGDLPNGRGTLYYNKNALPLMYTYDSYMTYDLWNGVPEEIKEQTLLKTAVLSSDLPGLPKKTWLDFEEDILRGETGPSPFKVHYGDGVRPLEEEPGFSVSKKGAEAEIEFIGGTPASETHVTFIINGLKPTTGQAPAPIGQKKFKKPVKIGPFSFEKPADFRFFATDKLEWKIPDSAEILICTDDGIEKKLVLHNDEYCYNNNRFLFTVNLGYREVGIRKIKLVFQEEGEYLLNLGVGRMNMDGFEENINRLKEDNPEITISEDGSFKAKLSIDRPKLLCLAVPYHEGFSATVNGKKTEIIKTNIGYMGVLLSPGENNVEFTYKRPLGFAGAAVSALAALICVAMWFKRRKTEKKAS